MSASKQLACAACSIPIVDDSQVVSIRCGDIVCFNCLIETRKNGNRCLSCNELVSDGEPAVGKVIYFTKYDEESDRDNRINAIIDTDPLVIFLRQDIKTIRKSKLLLDSRLISWEAYRTAKTEEILASSVRLEDVQQSTKLLAESRVEIEKKNAEIRASNAALEEENEKLQIQIEELEALEAKRKGKPIRVKMETQV